jgi:magnesium chelatase family protein
MLAQVYSSATHGMRVIPVSVEVGISGGIRGFDIVGLPDRAVRESLVRVRSALNHSGFRFPRGKVTVSLAPAGIPKEGPAFDLPIAMGILVASGQLEEKHLKNCMIVGELSLKGKIRPIIGVLPRIIELAQKREWSAMVPASNAREALCVGEVPVVTPSTLTEAHQCLYNGEIYQRKESPYVRTKDLLTPSQDFAYVRGQAQAKRGLLVAASGGHNVILVGPPGVGKTMLARCLPGILSKMSQEEILETNQIHSVAGLLKQESRLVIERPFRAPHHSASFSSIVGGGRCLPVPGEVSFSHNGVLFLDELPEFRRDVIEVLRKPMEDGEVHIVRTGGHFTFPSRFMLVAAMNPCPCGYSGSEQDCVCSDGQIRRYRNRVSGPMLDRIDIQLHVPHLKTISLQKGPEDVSSSNLRDKVEHCQTIQAKRYQGVCHQGLLNAHLGVEGIEQFCRPTQEGEDLLQKAVNQLRLSARAYHRVLKVARTIADLEGQDSIGVSHIAEAMSYRCFER